MFAQRLRRVMHTLERILLENVAPGNGGHCPWRDTTDHRGVDETFWQRMMLVFMDLAVATC